VKKTIQNTVKFNKLLEKIHQLLVKKIHDQPIPYNDIVDINSRANSLFDMYMNNKDSLRKTGKNIQRNYFKYLLYIKNNKKKNGKRTQATPSTLSVRD